MIKGRFLRSVYDYNNLYLINFPKWKKCRDVIQGEDSVKFSKELYLPKPSGMDSEDYNGYLARAQFFNASGRTLDGLCGMIGRKQPCIEVPKGLDVYLQNVDGKGHSLNQFISSCTKDSLLTNWGGILVDMPKSENVRSQRDFEESGSYAYMSFYKAEMIANWHYSTNGRTQVLQYVILKEITEVPVTDYSVDIKEYRRVCELDKDGYYRQSLYDDNSNIIEQVYPTDRNGKRFRFIPFFFTSLNEFPKKPMLLDLVNLNLSHYRKSADYENGLHWTGVPTPWSQGADTPVEIVNGVEVAKPLKLGGSVILNLPSGASLHYLEFGGSGCSQLASAMQADEDKMAILGARIISVEKKGVEAAETAKIHRAGENSVLAEFALNLSTVFSKVLRVYLEWTAGKQLDFKEVKVLLNTDYDVSTMNAQEISALVSLWQQGGISKRDLFKNLKDGEILSAERDFDEMNAEIDEEQMVKNMQSAGMQNLMSEQINEDT